MVLHALPHAKNTSETRKKTEAAPMGCHLLYTMCLFHQKFRFRAWQSLKREPCRNIRISRPVCGNPQPHGIWKRPRSRNRNMCRSSCRTGYGRISRLSEHQFSRPETSLVCICINSINTLDITGDIIEIDAEFHLLALIIHLT